MFGVFNRMLGRKKQVFLDNVQLVKEPESTSTEGVQVYVATKPQRNGSVFNKTHLYSKVSLYFSS